MRRFTRILAILLALVTVASLTLSLASCSNTVGGVTFVNMTGDRDNVGARAGKTFEEDIYIPSRINEFTKSDRSHVVL